MPDKQADRHKTTPKAVRMPDGLLARVEAARAGETVNAFIVAAIEERLERREGGSTAPAAKPRSGSTTRKPRADTAPPLVLREPGRPAHSPNCKCLTCKPRTNGGK